MRRLFKNTQTHLIQSPINLPSGIAVETEKAFYWVKDGKLYLLPSKRVYESWRFVSVKATEHAISKYKIAGKLGFRDGTLIKNIADGKLYLISQNKRRHIVNPDFFDIYGLDRSSIVEAAESETNMHDLGENL